MIVVGEKVWNFFPRMHCGEMFVKFETETAAILMNILNPDNFLEQILQLFFTLGR